MVGYGLYDDGKTSSSTTYCATYAHICIPIYRHARSKNKEKYMPASASYIQHCILLPFTSYVLHFYFYTQKYILKLRVMNDSQWFPVNSPNTTCCVVFTLSSGKWELRDVMNTKIVGCVAGFTLGL